MLNKLKANKGKLILSSVLILSPILAGVMLWERLPDRMATHWGADGVADGFTPRAVAVFMWPLYLLLLHMLCLLATAADKKNINQSHKIFSLIFWICPAISLLMGGAMYAAALGENFPITVYLLLFLGLMFVILGNYLPKCKQNHTIGIKIPWTLSDEENWNATHRFSGKVWVIAGMLLMASVFLPTAAHVWVVCAVLLTAAASTILYSYLYDRKKRGEKPKA